MRRCRRLWRASGFRQTSPRLFQPRPYAVERGRCHAVRITRRRDGREGTRVCGCTSRGTRGLGATRRVAVAAEAWQARLAAPVVQFILVRRRNTCARWQGDRPTKGRGWRGGFFHGRTALCGTPAERQVALRERVESGRPTISHRVAAANSAPARRAGAAGAECPEANTDRV